jgi:hypothetical protein
MLEACNGIFFTLETIHLLCNAIIDCGQGAKRQAPKGQTASSPASRRGWASFAWRKEKKNPSAPRVCNSAGGLCATSVLGHAAHVQWRRRLADGALLFAFFSLGVQLFFLC